jgi:hypothetical protein
MRRERAVLAWIAGLTVAAAGAAATDAKEVRKTVDLAPNGRVVIDTYKGWINVASWDRPQVEIFARVEPDESSDDRDQARKVAETDVRIEGSGSEVRIHSDYDRVRAHGFLGALGIDSGTLPFVRYEIKMPRTAHLKIKDYKSRTRIAPLASGLDLNTYKGTVEIAGIEGPVRLETYKGEVRVAFARFDRSEFETYKGDIEIRMPARTGFELDADAGRRGSLDTDFDVAQRSSHWRGESRRHEGAVNGGGPRLILKTYKGSFRIRAR